MSARNGDKSRFNRLRKQKILRRKRTQELVERPAKARKSAEATIRAQPLGVGMTTPRRMNKEMRGDS